MSLYKTTLYLPKENIFKLKVEASKTAHPNLTYHIQQAIKYYLRQLEARSSSNQFKTLRKYKNKAKASHFEDAVDYQRKLREEWT